jgi:hypothetical protein
MGIGEGCKGMKRKSGYFSNRSRRDASTFLANIIPVSVVRTVPEIGWRFLWNRYVNGSIEPYWILVAWTKGCKMSKKPRAFFQSVADIGTIFPETVACSLTAFSVFRKTTILEKPTGTGRIIIANNNILSWHDFLNSSF